MPDSPIKDVSDTAYWIAHHRAVETARPDAVFRDPLAARLAGERGRAIAAAMPMSRMTAWLVVVRTSIIDRYIRSAVAEGVDAVLNLGAGLDTRPYRMDLPEPLRWVEADYPHVIAYKEGVLAGEKPGCRLERVEIDLADRPARRKLLADVSAMGRRILVLTEGVVPYLTVEEAASLADDLAATDRIRCWVVDYISPEAMKFRKRRGPDRMMENAPFKFEPPDWFAFFDQHGWRSKEIRYLADEARQLHRPAPLPPHLRLLMRIGGFLASPARRGKFRGFAAYVRLEPKAGIG